MRLNSLKKNKNIPKTLTKNKFSSVKIRKNMQSMNDLSINETEFLSNSTSSLTRPKTPNKKSPEFEEPATLQ